MDMDKKCYYYKSDKNGMLFRSYSKKRAGKVLHPFEFYELKTAEWVNAMRFSHRIFREYSPLTYEEAVAHKAYIEQFGGYDEIEAAMEMDKKYDYYKADDNDMLYRAFYDGKNPLMFERYKARTKKWARELKAISKTTGKYGTPLTYEEAVAHKACIDQFVDYDEVEIDMEPNETNDYECRVIYKRKRFYGHTRDRGLERKFTDGKIYKVCGVIDGDKNWDGEIYILTNDDGNKPTCVPLAWFDTIGESGLNNIKAAIEGIFEELGKKYQVVKEDDKYMVYSSGNLSELYWDITRKYKKIRVEGQSKGIQQEIYCNKLPIRSGGDGKTIGYEIITVLLRKT